MSTARRSGFLAFIEYTPPPRARSVSVRSDARAKGSRKAPSSRPPRAIDWGGSLAPRMAPLWAGSTLCQSNGRQQMEPWGRAFCCSVRASPSCRTPWCRVCPRLAPDLLPNSAAGREDPGNEHCDQAVRGGDLASGGFPPSQNWGVDSPVNSPTCVCLVCVDWPSRTRLAQGSCWWEEPRRVCGPPLGPHPRKGRSLSPP
jgi:hypothetical protein